MTRRLLGAALAATLAAGMFPFATLTAEAASTPAGTSITNAATAQYSDGSGSTYTAQSNTVTTTVQNVPVISAAGTSPGEIFPNQTVTDKFVYTNSGNNSGIFTVNAATPITSVGGGTITGVTLYAYSVGTTQMTSGSGTQAQGYTCTGSGAALATCINNFLSYYSIPASGSFEADVAYTDSTSAQSPGSSTTYANTIAPTLTYSATGGASTQNVSGTYTDTDVMQSDALLDLAKTVSQPANASTPFSAGITFNNRGYGDTQPVSLTTLGTGLPATGIVVSDAIPLATVGANAGKPLQLNAIPTFAAGTAATGYNASSYAIYYTTASSLSSSTAWTAINTNGALGSLPSAATQATTPIYYVILVLQGNSSLRGTEMGAKTGASTGSGSVSTPQGTLTIALTQPGGAQNAIKNVANSFVGTNGPASVGPSVYAGGGSPPTATPNVLGPGANACYSETDTTANADATLNYIGSGGSCTTDGTVTSNAFNAIGGAVLLGPYLNATATGAFAYASGPSTNYDGGSGANTNNADFTAMSGYSGLINSGMSTYPTTGAVTFAIPNTVQNNGNATDTFTVTATDVSGSPTTGVTVGFAATAACTSPVPSPYTTAAVASTASGSFYTCVTIASGTTLNVFQPYGFKLSAQSVNDATALPNVTFDLVYPGGFVKMTKAAAVSGTPTLGTGSCSTATPLPGCTITYSIAYQNLLPVTASSTAGLDVFGNAGTSGANTGLTSFALIEDGVNGVNTGAGTNSANKNNWGCFNTTVCPGQTFQLTSGLTAAPTDPTANCTFSYKADGSALTVAGTVSNGNATTPTGGAPATAFACVYGGGKFLTPSTSASTLTFSVTIH